MTWPFQWLIILLIILTFGAAGYYLAQAGMNGP